MKTKMSIEQTSVVDAIATDSVGFVVLAISDHLGWADDPMRHMWLLQEKLNKYLAFVESGEIFGSYPHYRGQPIKIRVVAKHFLTDGAVDFYKKITPIVEGAGLGFEFKLMAD
jgi:hypothetical protein